MFHFGPHFLAVSSSSESVLDNIADYLTFISDAQSFWFTLNTSYNHGCHLASQFCLEPNDYKVLLVVAGLASYTQLGFAIKPTAWRKFLGGHRFAATIVLLSWNKKRLTLMHTLMGLSHHWKASNKEGNGNGGKSNGSGNDGGGQQRG